VPVGGGGLLCGVSVGIRALFGENSNKIKIYGVEPETAKTAFESFKEGKPVNLPPKVASIDSLKSYILRVRPPGQPTIDIMTQFVTGM